MAQAVSIPFKRESVSELRLGARLLLRLARLRFNSLQTGKWIQSKWNFTTPGFVYAFQFPSNGKVDSEDRKRVVQADACRFNSLQTGKWIQRERSLRLCRSQYSVSIPFKRESVFRERSN